MNRFLARLFNRLFGWLLAPLTGPLIARWQPFWQGLAPREQRMLQIGAPLLALIVLVFGIWLPLRDDIAKLQRKLPAQQAQLQQLQAMQARLAQLPAGNSAAPVKAQDQLSRVDTFLRGRLPGARVQLKADGDALQLEVDNAEFDRLLPALHRIGPEFGLFVADAQLRAGSASGMVGGRVRLSGSGT